MTGQGVKQTLTPTLPITPITPIYDVLLRGTPQVAAGLYQLHLVTAAQLTRLHYSHGSIKLIKARLKTLTTYGFVQADVIPSRRFRTPFYYTLGLAGMRYLELVGLDMPPSWRASKAVNQHWLFVEHMLELNDVLISALLLHRDAPRVRLESFEHERSLKRRPYKATWQANGQSQTFTVIPDAFLDFYVASTVAPTVTTTGALRRMPVLLEHDRGTEEQKFFRRRLRAYIMLLKTGSYQQLFGANAVTVAFTTFQGEQRVEQMRDWTRAELVGESRDVGDLFRFSALVPPLHPAKTWFGPQWYSAYEDEQQPQPLLALAA